MKVKSLLCFVSVIFGMVQHIFSCNSFSSVCRRAAVVLGINALLLGIPLSGMTETPKEGTSEKAELHNLTNENLLNQARTIFNNALHHFLAQSRGVRRSEILLRQAREQTESFVIPEEKTPDALENILLESARIATDHAKRRLNAFKQKLDLIQKEKELSDNYISQLKAAQASADAFTDAINQLNMFILEIGWRVDDGTLPPYEIPDMLNAQRLKTQKQEIIAHQNELKEAIRTAQKKLERVVSRIEESKKLVIEAEVLFSSSEKKYSQELKRQTLEQGYQNQDSEELISEIYDLQEERVWLDGAFNLAHRRFSRARTNADRIKAQLEKRQPLKTPKIFHHDTVIHSEEAQQTAKLVEEIIAYHDEHIRILREYRSSLQALIKYGEIFEGDATVLSKHLFRMQVLAGILERLTGEGKIEQKVIPKDSRSEVVAEIGDTVSKTVSDVMATVEKAEKEMTHIKGEIEKSEITRKDMKNKLANLKKIYESAQQAREWDSELKNLTPEQVVQKFKESAKALQSNISALENIRKEFRKAEAELTEAEHKFNDLKDPLLRSVQRESLEEKDHILKSLCKFVGMKSPAETHSVSNGNESVPEKSQNGNDGNEDGTDEESLLSKKYQNLLSSRVRVIKKRKERRGELLNALQAFEKQIQEYITLLTRADKSAQQQNAAAAELKRYLGRKQISSDEIPDGITEALKGELLTQIQTEMAELLNIRTRVRQQIESLSQPGESLNEMQTLFEKTLTLVGKQIDMRMELRKLDQDLLCKPETLSVSGLKPIEQKAVRRMNAEETKGEYLLSFASSKTGDSLADLLKTYYLELIELERKEQILIVKKDKTEHFIQFTEEEKNTIAKLLPFLRKQVEQLESEKRKEKVKIRARLMPQKAEELLRKFEADTGERLSRPPAIAGEDRADAVRHAADDLFERRIQVIAAIKWIHLFKQRLSPANIGAIIGKAHDDMAALDANISGTRRRIKELTGHSQDKLAEMPVHERPRTEIDTLRFLKGEIGVLRKERYQKLLDKAIKGWVSLAVILVTAIFLNWLTGFLTGRMIRHSQKEGDGQTQVVLQVLRSCFRFMIWSIAVIAGLSSLGFNVGGILAGLGIGGLAVGMAAKDTIANILGGVTIFLGKPFKVGDIIQLRGFNRATVIEIGIRSTRLQVRPYKTIYVVPNSIFSASIVENLLAVNPGVMFMDEIQLSRNTTSKEVELALKLIREILTAHEDVNEVNRVILKSFINYSYTIRYAYNVSDFKVRHKVRSEVNVAIYRQLEENGIGIALLPLAAEGDG